MVGGALASTIPRLDSPHGSRRRGRPSLSKSRGGSIQMPNGFSLAFDLRGDADGGAARLAGAGATAGFAGRALREAGDEVAFGEAGDVAPGGGADVALGAGARDVVASPIAAFAVAT